MKRRTFLKTVGSAAGAATLGTVSTPKSPAQGKETGKVSNAAGPGKSYAIDDPVAAASPFNLPVRMPGWRPDGADWNGVQCQRLFHEEVIGVGINGNGDPQSFPLEFEYKGCSKKWILGSKIARPQDVPAKEKNLTQLVGELAAWARRYNASLYRLRRLHFCNKYSNSPKTWPRPNPSGAKPAIPNPSDTAGFGQMIKDAEGDWQDVTDKLRDYLEKARKSYLGLALLAADMIAVNGYIVSMRVVVQKPISGGKETFEPGGSSSHVSISSPFSSSPAP
jgi:hypothetical protein